MLQTNKLTSQPQKAVSFMKSVMIGAIIGLAIIALFVFGVERPNPEWGKLWRLKPLMITPLAGASGGAFFYFMDLMSLRGMNKTVAIIVGVFGFVVALWLGTVLGLNGTMWD